MKIKKLNNKKEAYRIFFISIFLTLIFFFSPLYIVSNEPNLENLKHFSGTPTNPTEKISQYSKHIEFNINNNQFYYSGDNYTAVKNIIFSKKKITLKAYKNHGINNSINVVYTLTYQNKPIVTFENSTRKLNRTLWLLLIAAITSLAGVIYGYKQIIKFT